jgi:hypothetical protein
MCLVEHVEAKTIFEREHQTAIETQSLISMPKLLVEFGGAYIQPFG